MDGRRRYLKLPNHHSLTVCSIHTCIKSLLISVSCACYTCVGIAVGDELTEGNMNEGGWNLVEPEHATSPTAASTKTEGSSGEDSTMKEVMSTSTGRQTLKKEASFAWRGGQERQTTG